VSIAENVFSFRENENRSLLHLVVSKHRETWQNGATGEEQNR
jgi:hypothetical protein